MSPSVEYLAPVHSPGTSMGRTGPEQLSRADSPARSGTQPNSVHGSSLGQITDPNSPGTTLAPQTSESFLPIPRSSENSVSFLSRIDDLGINPSAAHVLNELRRHRLVDHTNRDHGLLLGGLLGLLCARPTRMWHVPCLPLRCCACRHCAARSVNSIVVTSRGCGGSTGPVHEHLAHSHQSKSTPAHVFAASRATWMTGLLLSDRNDPGGPSKLRQPRSLPFESFIGIATMPP